MISIEFECIKKHRFEGIFKDHEAYEDQLRRRMILCPMCECDEVKRIYTGCSIHAKPTVKNAFEKKYSTLFQTMQHLQKYVKENFEHVGRDFPDKARAMHYGIDEKRNVYGESTLEEIKELYDEGIEVMPLFDVEKLGN